MNNEDITGHRTQLLGFIGLKLISQINKTNTIKYKTDGSHTSYIHSLISSRALNG